MVWRFLRLSVRMIGKEIRVALQGTEILKMQCQMIKILKVIKVARPSKIIERNPKILTCKVKVMNQIIWWARAQGSVEPGMSHVAVDQEGVEVVG